jgi:predicted nucleotidyltransferase
MCGMGDGLRSRSELLALLRDHEADLRARGVETVTLFGSLARGEATAASDVDLAVRPGPGFSRGGFDHFGKFEALREHLAALLGCDVDLVEEPAVRPGLRKAIAEEGVRAF